MPFNAFLLVFLRLSLTMSIAAAIPLSLSWYSSYRNFVEQVIQQNNEELIVFAEGLSTYVDTWIEMNLRMLKQNTISQPMASMLPNKQIPILKSIVKEYEWLNAVDTFTPKGERVTHLNKGPLMNTPTLAWFKQASNPYGSKVEYDSTHKGLSWYLAVPIFQDQQKKVGILTLRSSLSQLTENITGTTIGKSGHAFLVNEEGKIITHRNRNYIKDMKNVSDHPALIALSQNNTNIVIFTDKDTQKKVIAIAKKGQYGWTLIAQQDYDEVYRLVTKINNHTLILFGVTLLIIGFLSLILTWSLFRLRQGEFEKTKLKFFLRLLPVIIIVAIVPSGINQYFSHQYSINDLKERVYEPLTIRANALVAYVNTWLDMNFKMLRQHAMLDEIISMKAEKQIPILQSVDKEYKWILLMHTIGPKGESVAHTSFEQLTNLASREWFQQSIQGNPSYAIEATANPTLELSVPILNSRLKVVGVLASASLLTDLSNAITNMRIGKTGHAYLLTNKGKLVLHPKKSFIEALTNFSKFSPFTELGQADKIRITFDDNLSKNKAIAVSQRTKHGLVLVVQQDYDEVISLTQYSRLGILIITLTFLLTVPVSFFAANRLA